jgi:predicted peroxiredoxin
MSGIGRGVMSLWVALMVASLGCGNPGTESVSPVVAPPRDGAFIHISHGPEDAHRVLMALTMAELMAADHDVLVYLDIQGIEVVLKDAPDLEFSHFPSSHTQLARLLELGVPIFACPGCLKAAGKSSDDLAAGIQVADKGAFFNFTKGRILTLDY